LAIACLLALAPRAHAQDETGTQYVTFWRGELRIHALRPDTRVTLIDLNSGLPLDPANWSGTFATNPFVLANAGDSFEADSGFTEQRIRIVAEDDTGGGGVTPVTAWTGDLAPSVRHPAAPPPASPPPNAWASYIPDIVQPGVAGGSEIGTTFLGFTSRDLLIVVSKDGSGPVSVQVDDIASNTDGDSDDTVTLDNSSPFLMHEDAEIEAYRLNGFEDDTVRVTISGGRGSVLAGLWDVGLSDWSTSPPSHEGNDNGRELGTLFYAYATRWLTIFPVFSNTTVTLTDLTDGDDSTVMNLPQGGRINPFLDLYVSDPVGDSGLVAIPRSDFPFVSFNIPPNAPIDDDLIRIESDRPILVYVGAVSSNVREFADVAYSIPVSQSQRFVHAFAQNGGANDLQLFSFGESNAVNIRSLSHTQGFQTEANHDFDLPLSTPWAGGNSSTDDWFWFSDVWDAELLRIISEAPIQVMNGDYDGPNFGAFLTWVPRASSEPPVANAGPDVTVCPDEVVTLSGTGSFDADAITGPGVETWEWDLDVSTDSDMNGTPDDDVDDTGETIMASFPEGTTTVRLTFTDDDGESSFDQVVITAADVEAPVLDCPRNVRGIAADFDGGPASPVVTATDDCDPMPAIVNDRTAGGADASGDYPCGVTPVTFRATDSYGKESSCTLAVVIEPDGGFPSVGPVLRVSKDASVQPVLDWSLASGLPADARYLVLRSDQRSEVRNGAPWSGELTAETWTDDVPGADLLFYDIRYVKCDGGTGGN
jgi:hypothetical protein